MYSYVFLHVVKFFSLETRDSITYNLFKIITIPVNVHIVSLNRFESTAIKLLCTGIKNPSSHVNFRILGRPF